MKQIEVKVTHTTYVSCANGTTIPNDILKSVEGIAEEVNGDIKVELPEFGLADKGPYHFDYDNDEWHDKDGYKLCEDGEWREDPYYQVGLG